MINMEHGEPGVAFNMGLAMLERIHTLLNACAECRLTKNSRMHDASLRSVEIEVWPWLVENEKEKIKTNRKLSMDEQEKYLRELLRKYKFLMAEASDPRHAIIGN